MADVYEPGSTFKIVAVCAAMNEGLVGAEDLIDCSIATVQRGSRRMRLPSDHIRWQNLGEQSDAKSSNRGAAIGNHAWISKTVIIPVPLDSEKN